MTPQKETAKEEYQPISSQTAAWRELWKRLLAKVQEEESEHVRITEGGQHKTQPRCDASS